MKEDQFSQEFLNAFVDDQLTAEEKSHAYPRISQDEALNRAVCELRKTRDLVQLAYRNVPMPPSHVHPARRSDRLSLGLAAGVALVLGIAVGWVLHQPPSPAPQRTADAAPPATDHAPAPAAVAATAPVAPLIQARQPSVPKTSVASAPGRASAAVLPAAELPASAPAGTATAASAEGPAAPSAEAVLVFRPTDGSPSAPSGDVVRVLIHVVRADAASKPDVLNEIESLARYYREHGQRARIEVVMNGEGLGLVRADVTAFAERIRQLQDEYDNLVFAACLNTIDRLKRERGITAQLLPGVIVIDSGVAQVMRRQQQGWAYIQV